MASVADTHTHARIHPHRSDFKHKYYPSVYSSGSRMQILFNYSSGTFCFALLGWFSGQGGCPGRLCHVKDVRVRPGRLCHVPNVRVRPGRLCHVPNVRVRPGRLCYVLDVRVRRVRVWYRFWHNCYRFKYVITSNIWCVAAWTDG